MDSFWAVMWHVSMMVIGPQGGRVRRQPDFSLGEDPDIFDEPVVTQEVERLYRVRFDERPAPFRKHVTELEEEELAAIIENMYL